MNVAKGSRLKKKETIYQISTEHTIAMYNLLALRYLCCTSLMVNIHFASPTYKELNCSLISYLLNKNLIDIIYVKDGEEIITLSYTTN